MKNNIISGLIGAAVIILVIMAVVAFGNSSLNFPGPKRPWQ